MPPVRTARIWYFNIKGSVEIIHIRLKNQSVESVDSALKQFFHTVKRQLIDINNCLIVVKEKSFRIIAEKRTT